jgi:DNA-binding NtrC family response regulator
VTPDRPTTPLPAVDILLVEDDNVLVTLLGHALHARQLTTDVAGDADEARRLLSRGSYKVIVLDMVLAHGTGFEVLDFIQTMSPRPPHVVVATGTDPSTLRSLDRNLVKTVFFKPLDVAYVASYVQTLAGRS